MNNHDELKKLLESPVLHNCEWVSAEWGAEHFGSETEGKFISVLSPQVAREMLDHIAQLGKRVEELSEALKYAEHDSERYRKAWKGPTL